MADLGTLPEDILSFASAINSKGQVVGTSCGIKTCCAFLWEKGVMTDLNTLINIESPLFLFQAVGINDRGQITGVTADFHAFLATPRPGKISNGAMHIAEGGTRRIPNFVLAENVRKLLQQHMRQQHRGFGVKPLL